MSDQQRTTVFIHTRPPHGGGRLPTAPPVRRGRRIGHIVAPVILGLFVVATLVLAAFNLPKGFGLIVMWFVIIPLALFCWHWGFNDKNR